MHNYDSSRLRFTIRHDQFNPTQQRQHALASWLVVFLPAAAGTSQWFSTWIPGTQLSVPLALGLGGSKLTQKSVTPTVHKRNQIDLNGSIWFHLYTGRVKGRPWNVKKKKSWENDATVSLNPIQVTRFREETADKPWAWRLCNPSKMSRWL